MRVNFTSSKDTGETRTIYVWIDNKNVMWVVLQKILLEIFFSYF